MGKALTLRNIFNEEKEIQNILLSHAYKLNCSIQCSATYGLVLRSDKFTPEAVSSLIKGELFPYNTLKLTPLFIQDILVTPANFYASFISYMLADGMEEHVAKELLLQLSDICDTQGSYELTAYSVDIHYAR